MSAKVTKKGAIETMHEEEEDMEEFGSGVWTHEDEEDMQAIVDMLKEVECGERKEAPLVCSATGTYRNGQLICPNSGLTCINRGSALWLMGVLGVVVTTGILLTGWLGWLLWKEFQRKRRYRFSVKAGKLAQDFVRPLATHINSEFQEMAEAERLNEATHNNVRRERRKHRSSDRIARSTPEGAKPKVIKRVVRVDNLTALNGATGLTNESSL